jgi:hypothetical protein
VELSIELLQKSTVRLLGSATVVAHKPQCYQVAPLMYCSSANSTSLAPIGRWTYSMTRFLSDSVGVALMVLPTERSMITNGV